VMGMMGATSLETFEEQIASDPEFTSAQGGCSEPTFAETDLAFTISCSYDKQAMTNTDDYPVKVTRTGETITMVYSQEATDLGDGTGTEEPALPTEEPDLGSIAVTVDFPGPIDQISGAGADAATKVDDDTIKITSTATEAVDITVTSGIAATSGSGVLTPWMWVVGGLLLLGAVGLVTALVMRSRQAHPEVEPNPTPAAPAATATGDDSTPAP
jgi:hypothetical protein